MKIIDLFCGAGGWSLGLHNAGHDVILAVDNWQLAIDSYSTNLNHKTLCTNILELNRDDKRIKKYFDRADIIVGSPPCKNFSVINPHRDLDLSLTEKFLELVEGKKYIMENVPPVRKVMKEAGHNIEHSRIIDMSKFGVPQSRRRMIMSNFLDFDDFDKWVQRIPIEKYIKRFDEITDTSDVPKHRDHIIKRMEKMKPKTGYGKYNTYYKTPATGITHTIVNVTKNMAVHPFEARRLKVMEAAVIQTFPPNYIFKGNIMNRAEQVANAVPPVFSEIIGNMITAYFKS